MFTKPLYMLGWFAVLFVSMYFTYAYAFRYYNPESAAYTPDLKPFTLALITHISGGVAAILLGAFQFIGTLRRKKPMVHRSMGKVYLLAVLISGMSSIYLAVNHAIIQNGMVTFGTGLLGLALAWLITSTMAFFAIKQRNFFQHREWMVRSYTVTCGFVIFRLVSELLFKNTKLDVAEVLSLMAWACWSIPLLITEVVLQARKIKMVSEKNYSPQSGVTTVIASSNKQTTQ